MIGFQKLCALIGVLLLSITIGAQAQSDSLRKSVLDLLAAKHAKVGVGIVTPQGEVIACGNHEGRQPMQSVYKFHLALTVLHAVDEGWLGLNQSFDITTKDLLPDTWSPLRDRYPQGGRLTLAEVLRYTVSKSDNNGCDILFRLMGGPRTVERYIRSLGVKEIAIRTTEEQMHRRPEAQYRNWATPGAMARLLADFDAGKLLSPESTAFLRRIMTETPTGRQRIKGLLPAGTPVAHKTGSSGTDARGLTAATNDVGIVTLPDGRRYSIAVFVSDSKESMAVNEGIIAEISRLAWETFEY